MSHIQNCSESTNVKRCTEKQNKHMLSKEIHMLSDKKLIQLMDNNPQKAMKMLMDTYTGLLVHIVKGRLPYNEEDVKECVSDVFIDFYKRYKTIDLNKGNIKSYLATLAHHKAIDRYRKLSTENIIDGDIEDQDYLVANASNNPEQVIVSKETAHELANAIKELGEPDDDLIFRRYYLMQPVSEIAKQYGMKSNTITKRISRALESLRQKLEFQQN